MTTARISDVVPVVASALGLPVELTEGRDYGMFVRVGEGNLGTVYAALRHGDGRRVAIKVIETVALAHRSGIPEREIVDRVRAEAGVLRRLQHPNVMRLFGEAASATHAWLVLEFIDGETLRDRLDRVGQLAPRRALRRVAELASAMRCWHDEGLLHRDLKPANLMLEGRTDRLVVIDFGIACDREFVAAGSQTPSGRVLGSPEYMAPEQCRGLALTEGVDIYAAGAILYELLTGRPPFVGASPGDVMQQHVTAFPVELRRANPALRALPDVDELDALVQRCLDKSPSSRYPSAHALESAIRALLDRMEQGGE